MILMHSCSENSNLCASNNPRHVYRYTARVWYALMSSQRLDTGNSVSPPRAGPRLLSIDRLNRSTYASRENCGRAVVGG
jgi:hypothetical protein